MNINICTIKFLKYSYLTSVFRLHNYLPAQTNSNGYCAQKNSYKVDFKDFGCININSQQFVLSMYLKANPPPHIAQKSSLKPVSV